jgi:hypothetical protein
MASIRVLSLKPILIKIRENKKKKTLSKIWV